MVAAPRYTGDKNLSTPIYEIEHRALGVVVLRFRQRFDAFPRLETNEVGQNIFIRVGAAWSSCIKFMRK